MSPTNEYESVDAVLQQMRQYGLERAETAWGEVRMVQRGRGRTTYIVTIIHADRLPGAQP